MELPDILLLAKLSGVVYGDLPGSLESNVAALGMTLIGAYDTDECRALAADWGGKRVFAFSGTHFETNTSIAEIFDNIDDRPLAVPGGSVPAGYYVPMCKAWFALSGAIDHDLETIITGHSMGGVRAHQAGGFVPGAKVVSFGAPKGGDAAYWSSVYPGDNRPLRVVHEQDFAPDWPFLGWAQPSPMMWLNGGTSIIAEHRTGACLSVADHSIDKYIAALDALNKATALRID